MRVRSLTTEYIEETLMKRMPKQEKDARWAKIPSYSVMPFIVLSDLDAWVANAKSITAEVGAALDISNENRKHYVERAIGVLGKYMVTNHRDYCCLPIDMLLMLHLVTLPVEERNKLVVKLHSWYKSITRYTPEAKVLPDINDYPIESSARSALIFGHIKYGSSSPQNLLEMFQGIALALYGRSSEVDVVLDKILLDALPEWAIPLGASIREMERYDEEGIRQYIPEHQVYQLYRREEFNGSQLFCTAPLIQVGELIKTILNNVSDQRKLHKIDSPRMVVYKLLSIVLSTLAKSVLESRKKGVVYSKMAIW